MRKRISAIITVITLVVTLLSGMTIYAGDSMEFSDIIKGLNQDGTVSTGSWLTVEMGDLNKKITGIQSRYNAGNASIYWSVCNTDYSDKVDIDPTYDSGVFKLKVDSKYAGKYIQLCIDDPGNVNYGGELIKIVGDGTDQGDSGQGGTGRQVTITAGPSIVDVSASSGMFKKNIKLMLTGRAEYYFSDKPYDLITSAKKTVKLYKNNKLVQSITTESNDIVFKNVAVSYTKKDSFKIQLFMNIEGKEIAGPSKSFTLQSDTLAPNVVVATKFSAKKVLVKWAGCQSADGYYVYMGKKLIKKVGKKTKKITVKKKKAGKSKYKVIPYVKNGKTIYKGKSNVAKPKKNQVTYNRSTYWGSYSYSTCNFVVTKISLKGKVYTVTGYACNNRIFKMKKYKKLALELRVNGKKVFKKTYKNKVLNVRKESSKKVTLKIKGKAGVDLANSPVSLSTNYDPIWVY